MVWPAFLLFSLMWALTAAFQFAEGLIVPLLATDAPTFAVGFEGISSGSASEVISGIPPSCVFADVGACTCRRCAVWGRDLPRRASCRAGPWLDLPSGPLRHSYFRSCCPAVHPAGGGSGGNCSGLAGICALVRTPRAARGSTSSTGDPATPPNRCRVVRWRLQWLSETSNLEARYSRSKEKTTMRTTQPNTRTRPGAARMVGLGP